MATSYLTPGVYIEEVPSANQTIAGVGTNTAGFIGIVDGEVSYPEFLSDDAYQANLKAEQDKLFNFDDFSDKGLQAKRTQADKDLGVAKKALKDATDKIDAPTTGPKAVLAAAATKRDTVNANAAATQAEKDAAKSDVTNAQKALDTAQKELPSLQSAVDEKQAMLNELDSLLKLDEKDRVKQAKSDAREKARATVPRYERKTFKVEVPAGEAKLCTNFSEYQKRFGPWSAYSADDAAGKSSDEMPLTGHQILSHGVHSFFINGGTRCFVARVRKDNLAGDLETALNNFESVESISLVVFPGNSSDPAVSAALVAHCEKTKYRFAILDAPAAPLDKEGELDLQLLTYDSATPLLPARTKHAAVYFPYVEMIDPALQLQQANLTAIPSKYKGLVCVPSSGAVAGIYARTDVQRGVFKAPANASVLGAQNVKYYISRSAQAGLNPQGVNCIRTLNGDITVWGARTCGGDENGEWRYVNVRRTFLFIAKSIDEGTQWVVFEPNDATLWGKVRRNVGAFLTTVWRDGALFGSTPEEAFYVKCDAENNPPDSREIGRLVIEVGVSIVKPAEFVIFRITQGTNTVVA